jgi:DNA-binding NtrC family response regulator
MNSPVTRILIVDDHDQARQAMADTLHHAGHDVQSCSSAAAALQLMDDDEFQVVVTDLRMPGMSGLELLRAITSRPSPPSVILVTAHGTVNLAVEAMRHGAFDFIEKPFAPNELESLIQRAIQAGEAVSQETGVPQSDLLLGNSPAMTLLRQRLQAVAQTSETVLISGESGTGKELVAKTLHQLSLRRERAFVALNCPALSPQLMESELFGHEKGAFTGAEVQRIGRFELADCGTLLLDEVSEIDPTLQAKLLRVLQERAFERVGSSVTRPVDVRVIATTNRQLGDCVREGAFRGDLYFRLAVLPVSVPALRERPTDIPMLCQHFLAAAAQRMERGPCRLDDGAVDLLVRYRWPGNVRELENLMTRATVLASAEIISAEHIRPWLADGGCQGAGEHSLFASDADVHAGRYEVSHFRMAGGEGAAVGGEFGGRLSVGLSLGEMERKLIEATLQQFDGHREKTSKALGIGVRTLNNKLRAYGYGPRARFANEVIN